MFSLHIISQSFYLEQGKRHQNCHFQAFSMAENALSRMSICNWGFQLRQRLEHLVAQVIKPDFSHLSMGFGCSLFIGLVRWFLRQTDFGPEVSLILN